MTRLLILAALLAGCDMTSVEDQIAKCHEHGYYAWGSGGYVRCCSRVNGDDICLRPSQITRHRRETGQ